MTSLRAIAAELGRGEEAIWLRQWFDEFGVENLRDLAVAVRARSFNQPPYPLGLPVDADLNAVATPVLTRAADGRTVSRFRGGTVSEPAD
jgi:hypothetical protein